MARDRRGRACRAALHVLLVTGAVAPFGGAAALAQEAEPGPDLVIAGASSAPPGVRAGDLFSYELTVTNHGDARAHDLTVIARMPRGVRVVNLLPRINGGRCSVAGVGGRLRFVVVCERAALAPGGWTNVAIDVQAVSVDPCRSLVMRARVEAQDEPADSVDRANTLILSDRTVCLAISLQVAGPRFAHAGDRVVLRFRVSNRGRTDLTGITLRDRACDAPPRRRSSGTGDRVLSPGHAWDFTCTATIGRAERRRHVARVDARSLDGMDVRAMDAHAIDVLEPSVRIELLHSPTAGRPGSVLTQRYRVTNTGDTELHHVIVRIDGVGWVGRFARLAPRRSALLHARLSLPAGVPGITWAATALGRDRLGLAVSDTTRSAVRIAEPPPDGPGTAFSGSPRAFALGVLAVALGLVGTVSLLVARPRGSS